MSHTRYKIYNEGQPHFLTATTVEWIPLFTKPDITSLVLDSLRFLQKDRQVVLYAYVIFVCLLEKLHNAKEEHKTKSMYQVWQEGSHPQEIYGEKMLIQKIENIHNNPVRRGYVDEARYWRYSSARNYEGMEELLEVRTDWRNEA
jgi:hypothetical protein